MDGKIIFIIALVAILVLMGIGVCAILFYWLIQDLRDERSKRERNK